MLKIAICDDDQYIIEQVEIMTNAFIKTHLLKASIECFDDGEELLEKICMNMRYDIIFMDIELEHSNGIEIALSIRERDRAVQIIYITLYDCYMREAFAATPVGFLSKPISTKLFDNVFNQALKYVENQDDYYIFAYRLENIKIEIKDILYFQSHLRVVNIVCRDKRFKQYSKLNTVENEFKERNIGFLRIHKSYLVNTRHVLKFSHNYVTLTCGEELPISRTYKANVIDYLNKI